MLGVVFELFRQAFSGEGCVFDCYACVSRVLCSHRLQQITSKSANGRFLETLYRPVDGNNANDYRTQLKSIFGIPLLTTAEK